VKQLYNLVIALIVTAGFIYIRNEIYKDMGISDMQTYKKDFERFKKLNHEVSGFYSLDGDFYAVMEYRYEQVLAYRFPTSKQEYLKDKLRYYDEVNYQNEVYYDKLKIYVENELKHTKPTDTIKLSIAFEKNKKIYLENLQDLLPLYNKIEHFFAFNFMDYKPRVLTNEFYSKLDDAIGILEQIKKKEDSLPRSPSLFFVLDGGHGKKIPLDDYETSIDEL